MTGSAPVVLLERNPLSTDEALVDWMVGRYDGRFVDALELVGRNIDIDAAPQRDPSMARTSPLACIVEVVPRHAYLTGFAQSSSDEVVGK